MFSVSGFHVHICVEGIGTNEMYTPRRKREKQRENLTLLRKLNNCSSLENLTVES